MIGKGFTWRSGCHRLMRYPSKSNDICKSVSRIFPAAIKLYSAVLFQFTIQVQYIVYVSINLCTFRKDAKGQQCVFILCMRNNMTTHCVLPTTTMRTAGSTGMLKAQIYGCILHTTHSTSLTHTQTHTRVNREDPIEEELQKKMQL